MKISYNWLQTIIKITQTPEEIANVLTHCGLEVESISRYETVKGGLKGVVVGEVVACQKHPDADKLSVTSVKIGNGKVLPIVCGAPNVKTGQKVLVAIPGTILYTSKGELEIKKATIRGQVSEGMLCAEDELGLGTSHEGIMVLPPDAIPGMSASEYLNLHSDYIFEVGLTPNRIDAASHFGVARDIAAVLNHRNGKGAVKILKPYDRKFKVDNNQLFIPVEIEDAEACPRYTGLTISNISVNESPAWLKERLLSIGLKPINNVVDATNFVLHEMGHPLHAFDAAKIKGRKIVVRKPARNTPFVTLDEKELLLTGEDLMICDATEPLCIGGILGGINSGVTENTTKIFLESAYFNPLSIRRSSKAHGIKTDASFRFERGADPEIVVEVLKLAAMLIKEVAGGQISSDIVDVYPNKFKPAEVEFNLQRAASLIGKSVPEKELMGILDSLDIKVVSKDGDDYILSVPTYRVDVTREVDVVEEILRIYGYNQVELPEKLYSSFAQTPKPDKEKIQNLVSDMLSARGFNEIMNNSLTKSSYYAANGFDDSKSVRILNPLSQDLDVLRQNLLFGGIETIAYNINRKVNRLLLYEFGKAYSFEKTAGTPGNTLDPFVEKSQLSLYLTGLQQPESWRRKPENADFFDLKAAVEAVFNRLGICNQMVQSFEENVNQIFDFGLTFKVDALQIATLGKLNQKLLRSFDIKQDVFFATIEWERLVELHGRHKLLYSEVARFPEVRRDLALLIDIGVRFSEIEKLAFRTEKKRLKQVTLFDVYQDARLGENKKSYAISLTLLDDEKTLTDQEIETIVGDLISVFKKELGAEIR
ncbi:MAG TPA: phenylalanine--tRNA ligase subunit beta [Bacteroidales bacterium]|nr:phenylalanine--tRNA ligase subunit beta [Bacteroidales bacterium]